MPKIAYADVGPKPSITIDFKRLQGENFYVTLLSEIPSTGPYSALGEHPNDQRYNTYDEDYDIWKKFVDYKDIDGFYFLQYFKNCTETSEFKYCNRNSYSLTLRPKKEKNAYLHYYGQHYYTNNIKCFAEPHKL